MGLLSSHSELKRLVKQGGLYINEKRITLNQIDKPFHWKDGDIIRIGKYKRWKVKIV